MTDLTKNFEQLSASDLADACRVKGIKVADTDDREALLKKLKPKPKK